MESSSSRRSFADTVRPYLTSIPLAILVAGAMVAGAVLYSGSGSVPSAEIGDIAAEDLAPTPVVIDDPDTLYGDNDSVIGNPDAAVTIVEFSDLQCPFCRSFFENAYAQIKKEYVDTGKVKLVFRHFPLSFHAAARPSAIATECAAEQGKFWQMHDIIFTEQAKKGTGTVSYGATELKAWAAQIGLNTTQFNSCLDTEKYGSKVDNDLDEGTQFGVSGTPSFFVNGELIVGAQPFEQFKALIEAAL